MLIYATSVAFNQSMFVLCLLTSENQLKSVEDFSVLTFFSPAGIHGEAGVKRMKVSYDMTKKKLTLCVIKWQTLFIRLFICYMRFIVFEAEHFYNWVQISQRLLLEILQIED